MMNRRVSRRPGLSLRSLAVLGGLVMHLAVTVPVWAVEIRLAQAPSFLDRYSLDRNVIRAQILQGIIYEQQALEALRATQDPESVADAKRAALEGYKKIRLGWAGIDELRGKSRMNKINPILRQAVERIDGALAHMRRAMTAMDNAIAGNARQLDDAFPHLEEAIALARQAARLI